MIGLRRLRFFVVLAEELHFGRAADRLHIAQPGLSQQIQTLETELGIRLLERSKRRVELTAAGKVLFEEGRRLLAEAKRVENLTLRTASGEIGRVIVAVTESATWSLLPEVVREYRKRYPDAELVAREMTSPSQIDALHTGEIDVAFSHAPVNADGLIVRIVSQEPVALLLPAAHRLAARDTVPLSALCDERFVLYPSSSAPSWADFIVGVCRSAGFEPQVGQRANEPATAISFVAAGVGVTLIPDGLKGLVRPGVICKPLAFPAPTGQMLLLHRPGTLSPALSSFLSVALDLWPTLNAR